MELTDLEKVILALCADDETELWPIVKRISKENYSYAAISELSRQNTIDILRNLLENKLIIAGHIPGMEFERLPIIKVDEVIRYIQQEWDNRLGKTPDLREICWFRATPQGEQLAHELGLM